MVDVSVSLVTKLEHLRVDGKLISYHGAYGNKVRRCELDSSGSG
jgi:hypothetical protein